MNYTVNISKVVKKQILKLPVFTIKEIYKELKSLETNPFPDGYIKLKGFENYYRIRVGNYRILYSIQDSTVIIHTILDGRREIEDILINKLMRYYS